MSFKYFILKKNILYIIFWTNGIVNKDSDNITSLNFFLNDIILYVEDLWLKYENPNPDKIPVVITLLII